MAKQKKLDDETIYHVQVKPGKVVEYEVAGVALAFGDRATLQVPGYDVEYVVNQGAYVVEPGEVPDVAKI